MRPTAFGRSPPLALLRLAGVLLIATACGTPALSPPVPASATPVTATPTLAPPDPKALDAIDLTIALCTDMIIPAPIELSDRLHDLIAEYELQAVLITGHPGFPTTFLENGYSTHLQETWGAPCSLASERLPDVAFRGGEIGVVDAEIYVKEGTETQVEGAVYRFEEGQWHRVPPADVAPDPTPSPSAAIPSSICATPAPGEDPPGNLKPVQAVPMEQIRYALAGAFDFGHAAPDQAGDRLLVVYFEMEDPEAGASEADQNWLLQQPDCALRSPLGFGISTEEEGFLMLGVVEGGAVYPMPAEANPLIGLVFLATDSPDQVVLWDPARQAHSLAIDPSWALAPENLAMDLSTTGTLRWIPGGEGWHTTADESQPQPSPTRAALTPTPSPTQEPLAPTPVPTQPLPNWTLAYTATFDTPDAVWGERHYEDDNVDVTRQVSEGRYHWTATAHREGVVALNYPPLSEQANGAVAADAECLNGPPNANYGLVLHRNGDNYYLFEVTCGYPGFRFSLVQPGQSTALIDWTDSPAVEPGGLNRLQVMAVDGHFDLFINGELVGQAEDHRLHEGQVGLAVNLPHQGDVLEVAFDNVEVHRAAPATGPDAPTAMPEVVEEKGDFPLRLWAEPSSEKEEAMVLHWEVVSETVAARLPEGESGQWVDPMGGIYVEVYRAALPCDPRDDPPRENLSLLPLKYGPNTLTGLAPGCYWMRIKFQHDATILSNQIGFRVE
jgi:hypothetical protein